MLRHNARASHALSCLHSLSNSFDVSFADTKEICDDEGKEVLRLLETPLKGFLGPAYNYDDYSLTEEWMLTFKDSDLKSGARYDVVVTR